MKFYISRASMGYSGSISKKPCKDAEFVNDMWEIDINSLEDLVKFIRRETNIIIFDSVDGISPCEITIYDDDVE